jgi:hypothetical protein
MKKLASLLFMLALIISCQQKTTYSELEKANWFLGQWENNTPDGVFSEEWKTENDSAFTAKSFFIKENDTLFSEAKANAFVLPASLISKAVTFNPFFAAKIWRCAFSYLFPEQTLQSYRKQKKTPIRRCTKPMKWG